MKIRNITKYYQSRKDRFTIWPIYDVHSGHIACNEAQFDSVIAEIQAESQWAITILGGDNMDAHGSRHKLHGRTGHYMPWCRDVDDMELAQIQWLSRRLKRIGGTIEASVSGNHDEDMLKKFGRDGFRDLHMRLFNDSEQEYQEKCSTDPMILNILFRRGTPEQYSNGWIYSIFIEHGSGGGKKDGAKVNALADRMKEFPECQLILRGHVHTFELKHGNLTNRDGSKREQLGIVQPSFMTSYEEDKPSYAESKGYPSGVTGCVSIEIEPDKKRAYPRITVQY